MLPAIPVQVVKLRIVDLLTLPYRICHPSQPSVPKVRSWGVTPIYDIQLDDVLSRKHLPPIGLKDFEEWLTYIDTQPENLYFLLWFQEYTREYDAWQNDSGSEKGKSSALKVGMFYARAKQTFFTPRSMYELDVPSEVLVPFYCANSSPHPHPNTFDGVVSEVRSMLQESLQRFVLAQYNNTGSPRALCGTIAGIVFAIVGGATPLAINLMRMRSRWLRLWALPGMFLGLTVFLCSIYGVCIMVWAFGDYRQLRKFELSRPRISGPQKTTLRTDHKLHPLIIPSPERAHVHDEETTRYQGSQGSHETITESTLSIEISPAFYDQCDSQYQSAENVGVPNVAPTASRRPSELYPGSFPPTAPFITSHDSLCDPEYFGQILAERGQNHTRFDFDLLPRSQEIIADQRGGINRRLSVLGSPRPKCEADAQILAEKATHEREEQYRNIVNVHPFKSPLTKILSPVITRAQWLIVVRCSVMAFLVSSLIIGCTLAIPESR